MTAGERKQPVLTGLRGAAEALEQGRLEEAAELLAQLAQICTPNPTGPLRLVGEELLIAKELFARCQVAADLRQNELLTSLSQSATQRKASHAYSSNKR